MDVLPFVSPYFVRLPIKTLISERNGYTFKKTFSNQVSPFSIVPRRKDKVVFVLGSTGTGKSKLAIDLAIHFGGEVVNSDKMQVYAGLNIITNKVTDEECAGIPHHLIATVHPDSDFTAADFRREAMMAVELILARGKLPIVAGGSNSYIEELVDGGGGEFRSNYECCFIWIDVYLPVLHSFVSARVDKMVEMNLVDEARSMFDPDGDYSKGIRMSIGVPEMDRYFRSEESEAKARLLEKAIKEIKENTCKLSCCQLQKIRRLTTLPGWDVCRVDATEAFKRQDAETWNTVGREPSIKVVQNFLSGKLDICILKKMITIANGTVEAEGATTTTITKENYCDSDNGREEHEHKVHVMMGATSCTS